MPDSRRKFDPLDTLIVELRFRLVGGPAGTGSARPCAAERVQSAELACGNHRSAVTRCRRYLRSQSAKKRARHTQTCLRCRGGDPAARLFNDAQRPR